MDIFENVLLLQILFLSQHLVDEQQVLYYFCECMHSHAYLPQNESDKVPDGLTIVLPVVSTVEYPGLADRRQLAVNQMGLCRRLLAKSCGMG